MPELPEVEITARLIGAAIAGAQIESALTPGINALRSYDPPLHVIEGRTLTQITRRGKLFVIDFDDRLHMLDPHRARLYAGHAGGAGPKNLVRNQRPGAVAIALFLGMLVEAITDIEDQLPRCQRRAAGGGRADGRAAAALRARERVEHLLPAHVGQRGDADKALGWTVERGHRAPGFREPLGKLDLELGACLIRQGRDPDDDVARHQP